MGLFQRLKHAFRYPEFLYPVIIKGKRFPVEVLISVTSDGDIEITMFEDSGDEGFSTTLMTI